MKGKEEKFLMSVIAYVRKKKWMEWDVTFLILTR